MTSAAEWSSTDATIAAVSAGRMTGVAPRTATITAERTGKRGQAAGTVLP